MLADLILFNCRFSLYVYFNWTPGQVCVNNVFFYKTSSKRLFILLLFCTNEPPAIGWQLKKDYFIYLFNVWCEYNLCHHCHWNLEAILCKITCDFHFLISVLLFMIMCLSESCYLIILQVLTRILSSITITPFLLAFPFSIFHTLSSVRPDYSLTTFYRCEFLIEKQFFLFLFF